MTVKICLNMIVKNESKIIERCLDNVRHLIDAVVIEDTGSNDNTIELINRWLAKENIHGLVVEEPWSDFGTNRTSAIRHAEKYLKELDPQNTWYLLFMDADNHATSVDEKRPFPVRKEALSHDAYRVTMKSACRKYSYEYVWLIKLHGPGKRWHWAEVCHEFLKADGWQPNFGRLEGGHIISGRDGARNHDPMKYHRDAMLFEKVLKDAPSPTDPNADSVWCRRRFYCAQSWKDAGVWEMAEQRYKECLETVSGWVEERYIAALRLGEARYFKRQFDQGTIDYFLRAFALVPDRLEAPYYLLQIWRLNKNPAPGYRLGRGLVNGDGSVTKPKGLFMIEDIYSWRFYEELALCAWAVHDKKLFSQTIRHAANCKTIGDPQLIKRIQNNLQFADTTS